jgi:hypothetical protein
MTVIRFNQWRDFVEELNSSPPKDRVVRITASLRYDDRSIPFMTLVAGYQRDDHIVEFVRYLGRRASSPSGSYDRGVQELLADFRSRLGKLGYEVKAGRYHVPHAASP